MAAFILFLLDECDDHRKNRHSLDEKWKPLLLFVIANDEKFDDSFSRVHYEFL